MSKESLIALKLYFCKQIIEAEIEAKRNKEDRRIVTLATVKFNKAKQAL